MKNKILIIFISAVTISAVGLYLNTSQRGNLGNEHSEHQSDKPIDQSHRSYEIEVTQKPLSENIKLNQSVTLKYKIINDKGEVLKDFAVSHDKLMHFIIVRKDLMQFQHLHPAFDKTTGEFKIEINFKENGPYRFFADFTPGTENPMKLPVTVSSDLIVGNISNFQPKGISVNTNNIVQAGPNYQVQYSIPKNLKSQAPISYSLTIEQNNNPVTLEKYLGALGHSVIIKEKTLEYIHTHAGEHEGHTSDMEMPPNRIDFTTTFPSSGKFKIFTQFQHQGEVYTTDYVVNVR